MTDVQKGKQPKIIVIADGNSGNDWVKMFQDKMQLKDGTPLRLIQCSWIETAVTLYSEVRVREGHNYKKTNVHMTIAPIMDSGSSVRRPETVTVSPHFLIIRNQVRGPTPESDRRHVLYGLMQAGVPSINSLHSVFMSLERPVMYAALAEIERRIGHEAFPLIPFNYYSSYKQMVICDTFPAVLKIGHAHRGMGKIKVDNHDQFRDVASIMAMDNHYCTSEPFIKTSHQIRVQKLGANNYRVFKKNMTGSGWKSQFGGSSLQEIPLEDKYKRWVDEASKLFGGLHLCAVDALVGVGPDGKEKDYVLELNDSPIGFTPGFWEADTKIVISMALEEMNKLYCQ